MPSLKLLVTAVLALAAAAPVARATDTAAMDRIVDAEHAAGRFDGVVLVGRGDAVVYQRAIGRADRERGTRHRVEAPWRWASVSKQVTGVLAMQQVQAGALSLDGSVSSYLPDFKAPNAARITVRQLLQHTSGLPNPDDTPEDASGIPAFYAATFDTASGPVDAGLRYCAGTPNAEPGAGFSYDNCDTLVLQAILERVTGRPYATLLDERIAAPLKLKSVGMFASGAGKRATRRTASPSTPVGYVAGGVREPPYRLATFGAGGALYGTPADLWRFDRALMDGSLLDAASMTTLWTGDPKLGYVALGAWSFPAPLAGCSGSVKLIERRGEIGGVQVRNLIAPDLHAALIVFSNTSATDFGEIWQGKGLSHALASAAFCG